MSELRRVLPRELPARESGRESGGNEFYTDLERDAHWGNTREATSFIPTSRGMHCRETQGMQQVIYSPQGGMHCGKYRGCCKFYTDIRDTIDTYHRQEVHALRKVGYALSYFL